MPKTILIKLSAKISMLLITAVQQCGSYKPDDVLPRIEENLTPREFDNCKDFLDWVTSKKLKFGRANLADMWERWQLSVTNPKGKKGTSDFIVSITRTSTSTREFLVKGAKSAVHASDSARNACGNFVFTEQNADYETAGVIQLEDKPADKNIPVIEAK